MKVINKSRKIIAIGSEALLPGKNMELPEGYDKHPSIADYLKSGMLVDAANVSTGVIDASRGLSDEERAKIAEEAIAEYKKQQAEAAAAEAKAAQEAKEAEIKAVKAMKKPELLTKAIGMGLDVKDDDKEKDLKEKIIAAINQ